MSHMKHATISAWQRHEEGGYAAEINGWTLRVKWHPETVNTARGFSWEAERPGTRLRSEEIFEEIEVAMADAEAKVALEASATEAIPAH